MARVSIEDCLNHMENRFALCTVASDRARLLMSGEVDALVRSKNKEAVTALREIAEGAVLTAEVVEASTLSGAQSSQDSMDDRPMASVEPISAGINLNASDAEKTEKAETQLDEPAQQSNEVSGQTDQKTTLGEKKEAEKKEAE